ncbi:MAG: glycosyltransferase [Proteobacteria bacterium]|nr:glycosyltransferase [Pseudomonadota bacterium]
MIRRVVHLIPTLEGGGAERQLMMLAGVQARRGWSVHVGVRRLGLYDQAVRDSGAFVHYLGDHRNLNPLLYLKIKSLIGSLKPCFVQTWLSQMDVIGGVAAVHCSVPWIVSERTSSLFYKSRSLMILARRIAVKYSQGVVANSVAGAEYWGRCYSAKHLVDVIPNAIDVDSIRHYPAAFFPRVSNGGRWILIVGRLIESKNHSIILESLAKLMDCSNFNALVIGEGPMKWSLEENIRACGLSGRVVIQPYRHDWWGLLPGAAMLISMSRYEGNPNVVLEAMAAGCPLIVSDISEHREFLDESSALLVPLDNANRLAEAIMKVLSDPQGAGGRALLAARRVGTLTVERAADAYESFYQKVMRVAVS